MTRAVEVAIAFFVGYLIVSSHQLLDQVTIDKKCDPAIDQRMNDCPKGYCCVRDEFLPTYVYCKKMGMKHDDCTSHITESNCPCVLGLYCKPNIESATFHSLYGKCQPSHNSSGPTSPPITGCGTGHSHSGGLSWDKETICSTSPCPPVSACNKKRKTRFRDYIRDGIPTQSNICHKDQHDLRGQAAGSSSYKINGGRQSLFDITGN